MKHEQSWQPTTTHKTRVARAELLRQIRAFFHCRDVLEVETPVLSAGTVTDEHIDGFSTEFLYANTGRPVSLFLQTSPEYAMKRLLCAQSGAIYQIGKAFRHEGEGRWHNPEFTMLEWYRPGFDHFMLMKEVDALLHEVLGATTDSEMITYQNAFITHLGIDPLTSPTSSIHQKMLECGIDIDGMESLSRDSQLQLLFSYCIEPKIGLKAPCFVYDFPASQAALAKISSSDSRVAERFEVYFKGIELANGFNELSEPAEQRERFKQDNKKRALSGLPEKPIDEHFLQALESGLPECAGVALGIDRLLMLKVGASHIQDVINFPVSRA